jgi:hypothetical protein
VARFLIVGCGCRGRALADALAADGHVVRASTRRPERAAELRRDGVDAHVADPDVLGTLLPLLEGTTVVCWLMGSASGDAGAVAALHGPRLASLLAKLVDSGVRGLVYEAGGAAPADVRDGGAATARRIGRVHTMPVEVVDADPADHAAWLDEMRAAAAGVLSP